MVVGRAPDWLGWCSRTVTNNNVVPLLLFRTGGNSNVVPKLLFWPQRRAVVVVPGPARNNNAGPTLRWTMIRPHRGTWTTSVTLCIAGFTTHLA
jgi:hypothetical protein